MGNRLFVGNLSYNTSSEELRQEFSKCGTVKDVHIVIDRESGRSRGFGFVEFSTEVEAQAAIQALDQVELGGRTLAVKVAEQRQPRPQGVRVKTHSNNAPSNNYDNEGGGRGRKGGKDRKRRREDSDWG